MKPKAFKILEECENAFRKGIDDFRLPLLFTAGIILAVVIRCLLLDFESGDYTQTFGRWYDFIKQEGFWGAFQYTFADYTPLYLHALGLATLLPIKKLYAIKFISIIFDFLAALFAAKIVNEKYRSKTIAGSAFLLILFVPTLVINGAMWAQSDVIFTSMILVSLFYLSRKQYHLTFILYGLALSTKPQALFVFPFYILLIFLRKEIRFGLLLYLPLVYFVTTIPSLLAGKSFVSLMTMHLHQSSRWPYATLNAPNMYQWLPQTKEIFYLLKPVSLVFTGFVFLVLSFFIYERLKNKKLPNAILLQIILLFSLIAPFFLVQMHERYFFLADILSVVYAFYVPRHFVIPIIIIMSSLFSYCPFLFNTQPFSLAYLALLLFGVIIFLAGNLMVKISSQSK